MVARAEQAAAPAAVILAAGKGARMGSDRAKVLHEVGGRPMVARVIDAARAAGCEPIVAILGHQREAVQAAIGDLAQTAVQAEQLGTGHAVKCAEPILQDAGEYVVVLSGDVPLIRPETIRQLWQAATAEGAACALLSAIVEGENRYGKVVRNAAGRVVRIVEHKDATAAERRIREINAGAYCFRRADLFAALGRVSDDNAQGEYYLTDVIALLVAGGATVAASVAADPSEVMGVDTPEALARAEARHTEAAGRERCLAGRSQPEPGAA